MLMELVSSFWGYQSEQNLGLTDPGGDKVEALNWEEEETPPQDNLVYRIQSSDLSELYENLRASLERQANEDDVDGNDLQAPVQLLQPSTIYVSARDISGHKLGGLDAKATPKVYYAELRKLASPQDREKALAEARKSKEKGTGVAVVIGITFCTGVPFVIGFTFSTGVLFIIGFMLSTGVPFVIGFTFSPGVHFVTGFTFSTGVPFVIGFTFSTGFPFVIGFTFSTGVSFVTGFTFSTGVPFVIGFTFSTGVPVVVGMTFRLF